MRRFLRSSSLCFIAGFAALAGCAHPEDSASNASALAAQSAAKGDAQMIVVLRDQLPALSARSALATRAAAVATASAPLLAKLQATKARKSKTFQLVNGFATTLSADEVDQLTANPTVLMVVPDRVLKLAPHALSDSGTATAHGNAAPADAAASLCNTLEPEALQLMNGAFTDPSVPQAQEVLDGAGKKVTGQGVKVGILADGIDPTTPGLVRADGTNVIFDYQDFSGDPAGTPTEGAEMYGDASGIAAQDVSKDGVLNYDISQFVTASYPLPSPCNIRVRGMAPGASLAAMKVFSALGYTNDSSFMEAIDWAVSHDNVDVLNESFGGNSYPDSGNDVISLANAAAVAAGVTVVVSSGDAGSSSTLGSPATNPFVIAAGASTAFRLYAQTHNSLYALATGFVSDNISSLSSGGFAQRSPRTPDLVAPGDLGWALCSTNSTLFTGCLDFNGRGTSVQSFGGTSQAAPLTSGAAALVIQSYRSTHGGKSPSPDLVKSILMGSAKDLGAPAFEQGAGIVDALKAVNTALSYVDTNGAPTARAGGLVSSPTSASVTSTPNAQTTQAFDVVNTSSSAVTLGAALQTLGAPTAGQSVAVKIDPATAPTFVGEYGPRPYVTQPFTVPAGADHLDVSIAWPVASGAKSFLEMILVDPSGNQTADTIPQGSGHGYGHVDVVKPVAGTWNAYIRTSVITNPASFTGQFSFTWAVENFVSAGTVSPANVTLAPGDHASLSATISAPSTPGDFAAALRLTDTAAGSIAASIPFTVRTLIPVGATGGTFAGALTGGNGRAGVAPVQTYAFDVPSGIHDMALSLNVADSGLSLAGYLIAPSGMALSSESNVDLAGNRQGALQMFRSAPEAGRWRFILAEPQTSGQATSIGYTARIAFNSAQIAAPHMPKGSSIAAGASVVVPVSIVNTGAQPKAYAADARVAGHSVVTLPTAVCSAQTTAPGLCEYAIIPPRATSVTFAANAASPIDMEVQGNFGNALGIAATSPGNLSGTLTGPEVQFGAWYLLPSLVGPFGPAGAPTENIAVAVSARIQAFDPTVTADTGNGWSDQVLGTTTLKPLVLAPGATGTLNLTFKPDASLVGKTVSGYVYVDTFNAADTFASGDEVVGLPYSYTVTN